MKDPKPEWRDGVPLCDSTCERIMTDTGDPLACLAEPEVGAVCTPAVRRLVEAAREALLHAEEYNRGCLYCGAGEMADGSLVLIDGEHVPAHEADCWFYMAEAALPPEDGR